MRYVYIQLIFNMQDFRYWLCTSILDFFGQVVSPLCRLLNFIFSTVNSCIVLNLSECFWQAHLAPNYLHKEGGIFKQSMQVLCKQSMQVLCALLSLDQQKQQRYNLNLNVRFYHSLSRMANV